MRASVYAGVLDSHVSRIVACRYSRTILIIHFVHAAKCAACSGTLVTLE